MIAGGVPEEVPGGPARRCAASRTAAAARAVSVAIDQLTDSVFQHEGRLGSPNHAAVGDVMFPAAQRNRDVFVANYTAGFD